MQTFDFDPNSFSKEKFNIGGISVYVYNSKELIPYVESFDKTLEAHDVNDPKRYKDLPVNVLYLVHQREGDYKFTESIAYTILKQFYSKKSAVEVPLICITFDCRNHGERTIDISKNSSWNSGNNTHALDLVSGIEGNIADLKLVMDYLPSYLNLDFYLSDSAKKKYQTEFKFKNAISGFSLGGHTVIRFANQYPDSVEIINPVVGCNDLSSLLINRLFKNDINSTAYDKKWFYYDYEELNLSDEQKLKQYPKAFHKYLSRVDSDIFEKFPFHKVKMFASFGELDALVPPKLSKLWADLYENTNDETEIFIQKDAGHEVTPEMIDKFTSWLVKRI